ncbi:hypothetical protein EVU96_15750 [Bacillus infantis]|uniref:hypothetical protein n=1 Tax=Bacillus infantis TaxID=324767 RepID=UPI00101CBA48|nr:hypothetical protein [Bacillus infantis]RYI27909.1 hypothetical protein EVU96_15750 [Bacillus infantis]
MFYQVRLLRGLRHPKITFYQLNQAEGIARFWPKFLLLVLASTVIHALFAHFGVGNEILSKEIDELPPSEFEAKKALFAAGKLIWGILYPFFYLFFTSLVLWTLTDVPFKKITALQCIVLVILLAEKLIFLPFAVQMGLPEESSPFSLGVAAQYITSADLLVYFLGEITLFGIAAMVFQYYGLKALSPRRPAILLISVIGLNLFLWLMSALISYIQFEKLL